MIITSGGVGIDKGILAIIGEHDILGGGIQVGLKIAATLAGNNGGRVSLKIRNGRFNAGLRCFKGLLVLRKISARDSYAKAITFSSNV